MFISNELIYLQLQKTACTHIASLLAQYLDGKQVGKHGPLLSDPGDRLIIGSIRNPWDWYVSLWAYGCKKQGAVYTELTTPPWKAARARTRAVIMHPQRWRDLPSFVEPSKPWREFERMYKDSQDPRLFRAWIRHILGGGMQGPYLENCSPKILLSEHHGLLTFRFLSLFVNNRQWESVKRFVRTKNEVRTLYREHRIAQQFIKQENLEHDLSKLLGRLGRNITADELKIHTPSNASRHQPASYYYDEETSYLVLEKKSLIVKEFGYVAP